LWDNFCRNRVILGTDLVRVTREQYLYYCGATLVQVFLAQFYYGFEQASRNIAGLNITNAQMKRLLGSETPENYFVISKILRLCRGVLRTRAYSDQQGQVRFVPFPLLSYYYDRNNYAANNTRAARTASALIPARDNAGTNLAVAASLQRFNAIAAANVPAFLAQPQFVEFQEFSSYQSFLPLPLLREIAIGNENVDNPFDDPALPNRITPGIGANFGQISLPNGLRFTAAGQIAHERVDFADIDRYGVDRTLVRAIAENLRAGKFDALSEHDPTKYLGFSESKRRALRFDAAGVRASLFIETDEEIDNVYNMFQIMNAEIQQWTASGFAPTLSNVIPGRADPIAATVNNYIGVAEHLIFNPHDTATFQVGKLS